MHLSIRPGGLKSRLVLIDLAAPRQRTDLKCHGLVYLRKCERRIHTSAASPNGEEPDFWEVDRILNGGDRWEALGSVASVAIPLFIVFAVAVGFFAAQTYNQDATVFLENAKSPEDTAKLYTFNSE